MVLFITKVLRCKHLRLLSEWYDNEHAPARLTVPGIQNALRYKAFDGKEPSYLAIYDADSHETMESDKYKALSLQASDRERALIPKLQLLNRKIYNLVEVQIKPNLEGATSPFIFVVTMAVPDELDANFNRWYSSEHIGEFAKIKGWRRCRRYQLVKEVELGCNTSDEKSGPVHNYLTIHDFDTSEFQKDTQFHNAIQTPWSKDILRQLSGVDLRSFELFKEIKPKQ
ncbi:hypothetical protein CPB83DRAFT_854160 [Crepidotus variabilis]|uniref:Uncharacterized protein n=1 Tax=Crepidotus variabilis TaxID=179855 RepID=A0A9P6EGS6_9AGAR|nr:hypothetical protein CPB83DRAFT_854160 [Crepidotus variabilis]